jgi:hypothetical protein
MTYIRGENKMNKQFTTLKDLEYRGYKIIVTGSYIKEYEDRNSLLIQYMHEKKEQQHAVQLTLEVFCMETPHIVEMSKRKIVASLTGDYKKLYQALGEEKFNLIDVAKKEINIVLHENEITASLEDTLEKAAMRQARLGN